MADRQINDLPQATAVYANDLLLLQQTNAAKKVSGQTLGVWLKALASDVDGLSVQSTVEFKASTSGTAIPTGAWSATIPQVQPGQYLWVRNTIDFDFGDPLVTYSVSYMGLNGLGSVRTVNGVSPDTSGNVALDASTVGAAPGLNMAGNAYFYGGRNEGQFPINKRGLYEYTGNVNAIDRWYTTGDAKLLVMTNGNIKVTTGVGSVWNEVGQRFDMRYFIPGRTYTASAIVGGNNALLTGSFVFDNVNQMNVEFGNMSGVKFSVRSTANQINNGQFVVRFGSNAVSELTIKAMKVELGEVQTLARKMAGALSGNRDWEPMEAPDYVSERQRCDRYLLKIPAYSFFRVNYKTSDNLFFHVPTPVKLNTGTVTVINPANLTVGAFGGSAATGFSISVREVSDAGVTILAQKTGHGITDAYLRVTGDVFLSAEL